MNEIAPTPAPAPIGFYMETAFHYQVYRSIITELLDRGFSCRLVISDGMPPALLKDMQELLGKIDEPRLGACLLSKSLAVGTPFSCLVSPYYAPGTDRLAPVHIRTLYGLAKEQWNHAWWNVFYSKILCYSHYSQQALNINGNAVAVGNPRFDAWHNQPDSLEGIEELNLDPQKPTLLYAPTFGSLSSIPHWAKQLERLGHDFNIITKLHHGTLCRPEEATSLALARRHLRKRVNGHHLAFPALRVADYVLTDNSGFIFDAIHAGKRTILLSWDNMEALLEGQQTFSSQWSPDQKIRSLLPVAKNIEQLRETLAAEEKWRALESELELIRYQYCDAWQDGKAGKRAANVIIEAITAPEPPEQNALLHSLRQRLFAGNARG
ncbi:CDP-glycerol glycerophosphotransferase family protein [Cedecea davisae]|uniref:CDP-glycerol glycerophosphotransferase family protein n=1 Tax=Cedecea davisae TaxID=158484 RepID=UPI00376F3A3E